MSCSTTYACCLSALLLSCSGWDVAPRPGQTTAGSGGSGGGPPDILVEAGVTTCASGFVSTDLGCAATLPRLPCPAGSLALPGDTSCAPICNEPPASATVFVDASFLGMSTGAEDAPFTTIQQGVDAGGIVSIAGGAYDETVRVDASVTLWGACPETVFVDAIEVRADAALHGLSLGALTAIGDVTLREVEVTGSAIAEGGERLRIERSRIDGQLRVAGQALELDGVMSGGAVEVVQGADATISGSVLFQGSLLSWASRTTVDGSALRESQIDALEDNAMGARATLLVRQSEIGDSRVVIRGSDTTISETTLHDAPDHGVSCQRGTPPGVGGVGYLEASLALMNSSLSGAGSVGVLAAACDLSVAGSRIADSGFDGIAILSFNADPPPVHEPTALTVVDSALEDNRGAAIVVGGDVSGSLRHSVLARSRRIGDDQGDGLSAFSIYDGEVARSPALALDALLIEEHSRLGIGLFSAALKLVRSTVRCNGTDVADQSYGLGKPPSTAPPQSVLADEGANRCGCDTESACRSARRLVTPPVAPL